MRQIGNGRGERTARLARSAARAVAGVTRAGAISYERQRHLPRLIRATPAEIGGDDAATTEAIVERLACALAAERRRGRAGHWTYSLSRHIALRQALAAERLRLRRRRTADGAAEGDAPE